MKCPSCQHNGTRVLDSRPIDEGRATRRRRECEKCGHIIFTQEDEDDLAEYFFKTIRKEQYLAAKMKRGDNEK